MLKLLKNLGKREWILSIISLILVVGQVWLELKMPDYMSEITVLVQTEGSKMHEIIRNGAYMLSCALRKFGIKRNSRLFSFRNSRNTFYENQKKII